MPLLQRFKNRYQNFFATAWSWKTCVSEIVGVAGFVFVGCGVAALLTGPTEFTGEFGNTMLDSTISGLTFGAAIFFMVSATAHNGGDQLNSAVTIALVASGSLPLLQATLNIVSQVLGAILGAGLVRGILPNAFAASSPLGANAVPDGSLRSEAFLAEIIGTFIATTVVLEIACNPRSKVTQNAPLVVGTLFGTLLIIVTPVSSGSLNPARTLGPAIVAGEFDNLWIWIFGPIIGALTAVPLHLLLTNVPSRDVDDPRLKNRASESTPEDDDKAAGTDAMVNVQSPARHSDGGPKRLVARPAQAGDAYL